jgi:hypothetical protein
MEYEYLTIDGVPVAGQPRHAGRGHEHDRR